MSSDVHFAPAFLTFAGVGLVLVATGLIVLLNPRDVGQRWIEWLYVHSPGGSGSSDAAFARSMVRYRVGSVLVVAFGGACIYRGVSDILGR